MIGASMRVAPSLKRDVPSTSRRFPANSLARYCGNSHASRRSARNEGLERGLFLEINFFAQKFQFPAVIKKKTRQQ